MLSLSTSTAVSAAAVHAPRCAAWRSSSSSSSSAAPQFARTSPLASGVSEASSSTVDASGAHVAANSSKGATVGTTVGSPVALAPLMQRRVLLRSTALAPAALALAAIGSDDATTIVNSVLSAYGLPMFKSSGDFKAYDEIQDDWTFDYPRAWVARPNTLRKGVVISDFQTADKLAVEELDPPADGDIQTAAVAAAVLPGGGRLTQDDLLTLPPKRQIKSSSATVDVQEYLYLEFPSETITRSGYQITRRNFVAAAVKRGRLYTLVASARSDQYNPQKKEVLQRIVASFRVR